MSQVTFQPLNHYVLLRTMPSLDEHRTEGGLIIPDKVVEGQREAAPFKRCKVLAAGEGVYNDQGELIPLGFQVGDIVVIVPHKLIPYEDHGDGVKDFIATAGNVLGTLRGLDESRIVTPMQELDEALDEIG